MSFHYSMDTSWPWEIRRLDARPEQSLGAFDPLNRTTQVRSEFVKVPGSHVGQGPVGLSPNVLRGVKLRRVGWEVFGPNTRPISQECLNLSAAMDGTSIPKQDHGSWEVAQQRDAEGPNVQAGEGAPEATDVQSHASAPGRDGKRVDRRDSVLLVEMVMDWRPPLGSPRSGEVRNEQESTLIDEDQMGSNPIRVFLYAATRPVSSEQWPSRLFGGPGAPASGNSNPTWPSASKHWRGRTVSQSASGSPGQSGAGSTHPWNTPLSEGRPLEVVSAVAFPARSSEAADRVPASTLDRCSPAFGKPGTSEQRNLSWRLLSSLRCGTSSQTSIRRRHNAVAFPDVPGLHRVSCP